MPDFVDALSSYKDRLSDYLKQKYSDLYDWSGLKSKKYRFRKWLRPKKSYLKQNISAYGSAYSKYFLFEFAPYVVAYGLMINFPVAMLLGWALTVETVISWGLVFYLIDEEFISMAERLKPYIRVKVDN